MHDLFEVEPPKKKTSGLSVAGIDWRRIALTNRVTYRKGEKNNNIKRHFATSHWLLP
jgi:hypothetical protein